jgi:hypothetical protein
MLKPHCRGLRSISLIVCLSAGCGGPEERYVPEPDQGRAALAAALEAWKSGAAPESVKAGDTPVTFVDARRQAGQKLEAYEILNEAVNDSAGHKQRAFNVRVTLAEGEPEESEYFIVGIDPIFVYRAEDYTQPEGM